MKYSQLYIQNSFYRSYPDYSFNRYLIDKKSNLENIKTRLKEASEIRSVELAIMYAQECLIFGHIYHKDNYIYTFYEEYFPIIRHSTNIDVLLNSGRVLSILNKVHYQRLGIKLFEIVSSDIEYLNIQCRDFYLMSYDFYSEFFDYAGASKCILNKDVGKLRKIILSVSYLYLGLHYNFESYLEKSYNTWKLDIASAILKELHNYEVHEFFNTRYNMDPSSALAMSIAAPKFNIFKCPEQYKFYKPAIFRNIPKNLMKYNYL